MQTKYLLGCLGLLTSAFSLTMLIPLAVALWYHEQHSTTAFINSIAIILTLGLLLWLPFRHQKHELNARGGFFIVVLFWATFSMLGSLPFVLSPRPDISLTDALFESVSGLTATGATVLTGLDTLPRSLLYYRQQLQFLGGMGVILLAIAILPALGVGGMQLFRAEVSGLVKDNKLTPRIAQSAKALWMIYTGLTMFCAISYWAAGMSLFDAIGFSFGTVSTGGFATHNQSIGYFQSTNIQIIAVVFMFLGASNFSLHFIAIHNASVKQYWQDTEFKTFLIMVFIATAIITTTIYYQQTFNSFFKSFIESMFHVVALFTTTGLSSSNYSSWPLFVPVLLLLLGLAGGCSGSTSGGIKIIRLLMLFKQGTREINRLIHPNGHFVIKLGRKPISDKIINAIWGFLAAYVALFGVFLILLLATGLDFITAYSATAATLSNIGPGLGTVASNYQEINSSAKIILSFSMLIGRLEMFTVLVLLSPTFWRS